MIGGVYDDGGSPSLIANVRCGGFEDNLISCAYNMTYDCPTHELAAVVCQGWCIGRLVSLYLLL